MVYGTHLQYLPKLQTAEHLGECRLSITVMQVITVIKISGFWPLIFSLCKIPRERSTNKVNKTGNSEEVFHFNKELP